MLVHLLEKKTRSAAMPMARGALCLERSSMPDAVFAPFQYHAFVCVWGGGWSQTQESTVPVVVRDLTVWAPSCRIEA